MKTKIQHSSKYVAIHLWLKYHFGKADHCEINAAHMAKRFEWALKKDCEYEKKRENFMQLCPSCHRKYDYTEEMKKQLRGQRRSPQTCLQMSRSHKGKPSNSRKKILCINTAKVYPYIMDATRKTGISNTAISNALHGRTKTAGGFLWQII